MSKYRFKTREEFIRDGLWDEKDNCPYYWNSDGEMNEYLGKDVPDKCIVYCDKNEEFKYDGWLFQNTDYVLKEQQEYFDDLSKHIGRYIRALVDNPYSGSGVKKGDVGKIVSDCLADFPNRKSYHCICALSENHLGVKYELLPEDYSPEQEIKEPSIEFIPGKWYNFTTMKGKYNLYVKVSSVTDKNLFFSNGESISNGHFGEAYSINIEFIENPRLVEDLSEIQEYLPEGHPDKIKVINLEIGKWYKWYQKNHGNYHYGKVERINLETDNVVMKPWIIQCDEYQFSGYFALSEAEQFQEISVEDVQEFLPKNHSDKISSDEFKKGEYIVIILKVESFSKDFISNYIYKQREDYKHLRPELGNYSSKTNGWETIGKNNSHNWRYATQEEIDEYERRGKPYDVTELQKKELSMKEIQEECKKKFPIGCTYLTPDESTYVLKDDSYTYYIVGQTIWAHSGGGLLYADGKYATLVSLPEETITEIPEYVECVSYDSKHNGKIFNTIIDKSISEINSWEDILIKYDRLKDGCFKISNKEAYEQQKSWSETSEESSTKFIMGTDPYEVIIANKVVYDELGQYPLTPSECWKEIPKFTEQKFDIYGPTPDIE